MGCARPDFYLTHIRTMEQSLLLAIATNARTYNWGRGWVVGWACKLRIFNVLPSTQVYGILWNGVGGSGVVIHNAIGE